MAQPVRMAMPVAGLSPIPLDEANSWLARWGHDLGDCDRPFGVIAWALEVDARPVAVAISASTVSATVPTPWRTYRRGELVELARICSDPAERWATRPMLRLWREVDAARWPHWAVHALVAYSHGRRRGDLYRWDGWTLVNDRAGTSGGGGQWSTRRVTGDPVLGRKRCWVYPYPRKKD